MFNDHSVYYTAMESKDARFDGRFYIGVHTTGIYCRPICPAPKPKRKNVSFYKTAASAKNAGFRPCLRCLPESSPGTPEWDPTSSVISQAMRLISAGYLNSHSVKELSEKLFLSDRQLRRLFDKHIGASPQQVAQTQRLHFAKKLISDTQLSMSEIAFSAGYKSVRRFNDAVQKVYQRAPKTLRKSKSGGGKVDAKDYVKLNLAYRPPYQWDAMLAFLKARAIPGVEQVDTQQYQRTVKIGNEIGIIKVHQHQKQNILALHVSSNLHNDLFTIVERVKRIFDLSAFPDEITNHLSNDRVFAKQITIQPGLRIPGAWDGFEIVVRAILGQQVSVKAANTFAGRIVNVCGEELPKELLIGSLTNLFPTPTQIIDANLNGLGITTKRIAAIKSVAEAIALGVLKFDGRLSQDETQVILSDISGIGEWTIQYIAMRVLGNPDAFPASDLGLRKAIGIGDEMVSTKNLQNIAESWQPWRAYAAINIWHHLSNSNQN